MTSSWKLAGWALLPMLVVVLVRLAGPMNVDDTDQSKQALYLVDVMENGNWILPMERGVQPATKPPVLTWIAAVLCAPLGTPSYFVARFVSAICALLMAWILFRIGSERWSPSVGLVAAWTLAASHPVVLLCTHFRTDMLLAASVMGTLFALHRLELRGMCRGMAWLFWATLSFAVFVKGPPGLLVVGSAVGALMLSRRWRELLRPVWKVPGWTLLLVPLAWFILAYAVGGNPYVKYTVLRETFDRVSGTGTRAHAAQHPPGYLFLHFLAKSAPWSLFALLGVGFAFSRKVAPEAKEKVLLLAAWLCVPMIVFNLSKGQRPDYLLPLLPAASAMAASLMLDPARPWVASLWKASVWITAAVAAALSISALAGLTFGLKGLRAMAEDGGVAWGVGMGLTAALLASGALLRSSGAAPGQLTPGFLLALLGFFIANLAYTATISPGATAGRGEALIEFAETVRKERRPGDELRIYGVAITNGVHYYLGLNQPAVSPSILPVLLERSDRPGRLLLATNDAGAAELQRDWPGRFETLARRRQGRKMASEHVLVTYRDR